MAAQQQRQVRPSPKQQQAEARKDWYPYYAGFNADYVRYALVDLMGRPSSVLDPWNGSGTTTVVATESGIASTGIDLNPAMAVIAQARLHPAPAGEDALRDAKRATVLTKSPVASLSDGDPLLAWFKPSATAWIRSLAQSIEQIGIAPAHAAECATELRTALLTAALMAATRDLMARFRSRNPAWITFPESKRHRLSPSCDDVFESFLQRCQFLIERLTVQRADLTPLATISTGSASELPPASRWESCLTSPPYATRIDYVRSTLPELGVLGVTHTEQTRLRQMMTGTPVVRGAAGGANKVKSSTARKISRAISQHSSHGSGNYYGPWISNYFGGLDRSLQRVSRAVLDDGPIAIIVQDSYYKEVHIDLQGVVIETLSGYGRSLEHREDFAAPHLMSRINSGARPDAGKRHNHESLLLFR